MNADKIKKIIDSFRNINVRDLQNIDARQLGYMVRQHVDMILNIVLILGTIAVTVYVFKGYSKRSQTLALESTKMQERVEVSKESERLHKDYDAFVDGFPKFIVTDQLINKLSEFAAYRHVQILSFSPAKEKADDYIKVARVQINVAADDYKDMILFMKDIEDAPYALRVERWSAKMKEQSNREGTRELKKQIVEANMEIGIIQLQDE